VDSFISKKDQKRMDAFSHYAVAAAKGAASDAGLDFSKEDPTRIGVIVGSGIGGLLTIQEQLRVFLTKGPDRCSPFMIPQMISNMASGLIGIEFGVKGPNYSVVSACASAAHSIGDAMILIQRGSADVMIAGGSEASVCGVGVAGFCALRALCTTRNDDPTRASRPFDANRSGFVMAEGAGIVVLEEWERAKKRGARIYCELAGYGITGDAFHMTAPPEGGEGAARAMAMAMDDARVGPDQIDYINAHGTSTELNDRAETAAIKTAFGPDRAKKIMVSSSKSMTGHLLGAAAGIETIVCALALQRGIAPPTINYDTPDPACDLDYVPNVARESPIRACLNNSFGFGGHNAVLLMKKVS
jgi:3-oxoacyl-[acyl-carrier-protein] synthase II